MYSKVFDHFNGIDSKLTTNCFDIFQTVDRILTVAVSAAVRTFILGTAVFVKPFVSLRRSCGDPRQQRLANDQNLQGRLPADRVPLPVRYVPYRSTLRAEAAIVSSKTSFLSFCSRLFLRVVIGVFLAAIADHLSVFQASTPTAGGKRGSTTCSYLNSTPGITCPTSTSLRSARTHTLPAILSDIYRQDASRR